jgi:hypothetical protein
VGARALTDLALALALAQPANQLGTGTRVNAVESDSELPSEPPRVSARFGVVLTSILRGSAGLR